MCRFLANRGFVGNGSTVHYIPEAGDDVGLVCFGFWQLLPPKAAADCQTLSFSASFYKIR
jgi:hypothetical protein